MIEKQISIGKRVRSLKGFSGVPEGSVGTIDEDYGTGIMVCWDPPISRWVGLVECRSPMGNDPFQKAAVKGFLRDGFDKKTELQFLVVVRKEKK